MRYFILFMVMFFINTENSQARLITYEASGFGFQVFEHNHQTGVNTIVTNSSIFGFNLRNNDPFNVIFTYDTSAIESNFRQIFPDRNAAIYGFGLINYRVNIGEVSELFNSVGSIQIWDNRSGTDSFSVSNSKVFDNLFMSSSFNMFDYTGTSQTGFSIPENLDNIFNIKGNQLSFAWVDRNNGNQLHYTGRAETLKIRSISEPELFILLLIGLLIIYTRLKPFHVQGKAVCQATTGG